MKRFLVFLLALAMVFAFAATAFAADTQIEDYADTDIQATAAQQAAVYKLTALGVLNGLEDGQFGFDQNLTRAQFAKVLVYLTNNEDMYDYYAMFAPSFSDVGAGHWA